VEAYSNGGVAMPPWGSAESLNEPAFIEAFVTGSSADVGSFRGALVSSETMPSSFSSSCAVRLTE
jgi:hypothetical protein